MGYPIYIIQKGIVNCREVLLTMLVVLLCFMLPEKPLSQSNDRPESIRQLSQHSNWPADLTESIYRTSDGAIWFGFSHSGLYRFNGYCLRSISPKDFGLPENAFQRVIGMKETKDRKIYVFSRGQGVSIISFTEKTGSHPGKDLRSPLKEAVQRVWDLYEEPDGTIWLATWKGLVKYRPETKTWELYHASFKTNRNDAVHPSAFRRIVADSENPELLWIAGISGLLTFNTAEHSFVRHKHPSDLYEDGQYAYNPEHAQYLMTDMVIYKGKIYLASWGGGLMIYDLAAGTWKKKTFQSYSKGQSLDENIVHRLELVGDKFYLTTQPGLMLYDLKKDRLNHDIDCQNSGIVNTYALEVDGNQALWISSYENHSFRYFPLEEAGYANSRNIEFCSISLDGELSWDMAKDTLPVFINIPAKCQEVDVEFALNNPSDTADVEYQFMLSNYTKGWISLGSQNWILIDDLKKGDHELLINGREKGGEWSVGPPIIISRQEYFYRQSWFFMLSGLLLAGILFFIIRKRMAGKLEKEKTQRMITELKMQSLQAQMNPHFIFNSLTSINHFILKEDTEKASDHLRLFSDLLRKVLMHSDKKLIPLKEEIAMLEKYIQLEMERFSGKFDWSIKIDPKIDPDNCMVPPLLIQPYVENAIWHGLMPLNSRGSLVLNYRKNEGYLEIDVIDDGIGMQKAKVVVEGELKKNGKGRIIAGNRIEMINKLFDTPSEVSIAELYPDRENKGTRISVRIPFINNIFDK
jgi:hypothetical protein